MGKLASPTLIIKIIKSWLRFSMTQDRFTDLSTLNIESDSLKNNEINKIMDVFADNKGRKCHLKF